MKKLLFLNPFYRPEHRGPGRVRVYHGLSPGNGSCLRALSHGWWLPVSVGFRHNPVENRKCLGVLPRNGLLCRVGLNLEPTLSSEQVPSSQCSSGFHPDRQLKLRPLPVTCVQFPHSPVLCQDPSCWESQLKISGPSQPSSNTFASGTPT